MRLLTGPRGGRCRRTTDRMDPPRFRGTRTVPGTAFTIRTGCRHALAGGGRTRGIAPPTFLLTLGVGWSRSLVTKDHGEVGSLSGGVMSPRGSTPVRSITERHSLAPRSHTRSPIGSPCGSRSLAGGLRAYPVASPKPRGLGPASPPVARHLRGVSSEHPDRATHLLVQAYQHLWLVLIDDAWSGSPGLTRPRTPGPRPP
jgi:hypothetical protein